MTRNEAVLRMVAEQLGRINLDSPELRSIVCIIRLRPGGGSPRSVQVNLEYEHEPLPQPEGSLDSGGRFQGKPR